MAEQSDDLTQASQAAGAQVNSVQDALREVAAELNSLTDNSTTRLADASLGMRRRLDDIGVSSDQAVAKLNKASAAVQHRAAELSVASEAAGEAAGEAETSFAHSAKTAAHMTDKNLSKLKAVGELLRRQVVEVDAASDKVTSKMGLVGGQLRGQLDELSETFNEALKGIEQVGGSFTKQAGEALNLSGKTVSKMADMGAKLEEQTENLTSVSAQVNKETQEVTDELGKRTKAMAQVTKQAVVIEASLKEQAKESGAENFVKRMDLISEGLESLAIDINRVLETRITEEDWRRFNKGDKALFLRKILGMRKRSKLAAIKKQFRENREFRGYVTRYMSQFNDLLKYAKRTENGGMMASTLLTSDVGKVYMVLAGALDREPAAGPTVTSNPGAGVEGGLPPIV